MASKINGTSPHPEYQGANTSREAQSARQSDHSIEQRWIEVGEQLDRYMKTLRETPMHVPSALAGCVVSGCEAPADFAPHLFVTHPDRDYVFDAGPDFQAPFLCAAHAEEAGDARELGQPTYTSEIADLLVYCPVVCDAPVDGGY